MAAPRNRRQFLKDTLAIPAGAAALNLGWTVTTGCAKPEMAVRSGIKTSCCAYSYRQLLDLKKGKWTMFDFIDKAVELGVADPHRVGVGGRSYGAFMAANLLAHSDLFRAGVAGSGAYNHAL